MAPVTTHWQTSRFTIDLAQPQVMGIVNVTPDSFSDGGQHANAGAALRHCEQLLRDGAHILDIGGESSRPGAAPLPLAEELARVLPVVRGAVAMGLPVSVDTYKPQVMQAVLDLGADIINDIWALRQPGAAAAVARHGGCGVCLMHMHREPQTMQVQPMQGDVVPQVAAFLQLAAAQLVAMGLAPQQIVLDPGIGFGKTVAQNFSLLQRQQELVDSGFAWVAGWSRKSSLAAATSTSLADLATMDARSRLVPSVSAALLAVERGARIVRVHDVRETVQALAVLASIR
jgi:dihydropteroate synthase